MHVSGPRAQKMWALYIHHKQTKPVKKVALPGYTFMLAAIGTQARIVGKILLTRWWVFQRGNGHTRAQYLQ